MVDGQRDGESNGERAIREIRAGRGPLACPRLPVGVPRAGPHPAPRLRGSPQEPPIRRLPGYPLRLPLPSRVRICDIGLAHAVRNSLILKFNFVPSKMFVLGFRETSERKQ